jgi:hypothetical protein
MLTINLSKAQQEIGELDDEMAVLLNEAVNFLSPRGGLIEGDAPQAVKMVGLAQLAEIEPKVALFCLRWLMIDDTADFCRHLACEMVEEALGQHSEALGDGVAQTLIYGEFNLLPTEQQIARFATLKAWGDCYMGALHEDPSGYAIDVARAAIADTSFDSIIDPDEFVLDAPLRVFKAWVDLAVAANPAMLAAGRMLNAAAESEAQWRKGTKLEFDFSARTMEDAYWAIWNAISSGIEAETNSCARSVIAEMESGE